MEPKNLKRSKPKAAEPRPTEKLRRFRVVRLEERIAPSTANKAAQELTGVLDVNPNGTVVFGGC
jgi:hypothetical protein